MEAYSCWSQVTSARKNNYGTRIDLILAADPEQPSDVSPGLRGSIRDWVGRALRGVEEFFPSFSFIGAAACERAHAGLNHVAFEIVMSGFAWISWDTSWMRMVLQPGCESERGCGDWMVLQPGCESSCGCGD